MIIWLAGVVGAIIASVVAYYIIDFINKKREKFSARKRRKDMEDIDISIDFF